MFSYWNEYKNYIKKKKINEKKIYAKIKDSFNIDNFLELITIYSSLIIIGKFTLSLKIRRLFEKLIRKKKFIYKTKYIKIILRTINFLQSQNFNNKKKILFLKNLKHTNGKLNIRFKNFLKNKKIAIVGVSNSSLKNGKRIEQKNIVVKFNFFSNKYYNDKDTQSKRCDVSYLSDFFLENKISLLKKKDNKIKFFVTKKDINKKLNYIKDSQKVISNVYEDVLLGTPSLLIRTILDLLRHDVMQITIFNSTLQLLSGNKTRNSNTKRYRKFPLEKKYNIFTNAKSFGVHDIISEYIIIKNLAKVNLIDVDSSLNKILKIGLTKYLKKMEKLYANSIRVLLTSKNNQLFYI